MLNVTFTGNARVFKKNLYNGIPSINVRGNVFVTHCNTWNTIVKLF
jgi:hypothetical protein